MKQNSRSVEVLFQIVNCIVFHFKDLICLKSWWWLVITNTLASPFILYFTLPLISNKRVFMTTIRPLLEAKLGLNYRWEWFCVPGNLECWSCGWCTHFTVLFCLFRGRVEETSRGDERWDNEAGAWEREVEKTWPWAENEWNPKDQVMRKGFFFYSRFQTVQCLIFNLCLILNFCIALRPEDSPPPPKAQGPATNGTGELWSLTT